MAFDSVGRTFLRLIKKFYSKYVMRYTQELGKTKRTACPAFQATAQEHLVSHFSTMESECRDLLIYTIFRTFIPSVPYKGGRKFCNVNQQRVQLFKKGLKSFSLRRFMKIS